VSPTCAGDRENCTRRQDRAKRRPHSPGAVRRPGDRRDRRIAQVSGGVLTILDSTPHPFEKEAVVGIGTSIFLIALGAILTFALDASVGGINLDVVGWILMAAGVLGLIMTSLIWGRRRREVVTTAEPVEYRRPDPRRTAERPVTIR
jgi:hypothetical protein